MTATFLVTLIFLLSTGAPVNKAVAHCEGITLSYSYESDLPRSEEGTALQLDARGATLFTVWQPSTITCAVHYQGEWWRGPVDLKTHGQVTRVYLRKDF